MRKSTSSYPPKSLNKLKFSVHLYGPLHDPVQKWTEMMRLRKSGMAWIMGWWFRAASSMKHGLFVNISIIKRQAMILWWTPRKYQTAESFEREMMLETTSFLYFSHTIYPCFSPVSFRSSAIRNFQRISVTLTQCDGF